MGILNPRSGEAAARVIAPAGEIPVFDALRALALFAGVPDADLRTIASFTRILKTYRGQTIVEEGEEGNIDLLVLLRGRTVVQIEALTPHVEVGISTLGPGDVIGEMSLIESIPRSATVMAADEGEVCVINGRELKALLEGSPVLEATVMRNLARVLGARLRVMNRRMMAVLKNRYY